MPEEMRWPVLITRCAACGDRRKDPASHDGACDCGWEQTVGVEVVPATALYEARAEVERLRAIVAEVTQVIKTGWLPNGDSLTYYEVGGEYHPCVAVSDYAEDLRDRGTRRTAEGGSE